MQDILDFIQSIYNTKEFIPLHEPRFLGNEKLYVNECIDSTFVSSVGKFVDRFEVMLAEFTGAKYAVAVVNGTQALYVAMELAGVQSDDEVITQSLSFVATANAIRYHNAWPVFVDVDRDTMGMSPDALHTFLKTHTKQINGSVFNALTGRKIAAVVPMHTLGHACRIEEIVKIASDFGLVVVEDAAESLGTTVNGHHTGTFGLLGSVSFNGNKLITTGGGGMILTNDEALAKQAKHITTTAKVPHRYEFEHDQIAYNFRLPNLNAALGVAQMERLSELLAGQKNLAKKYRDYFKPRTGIEFMAGLDGKDSASNFWINAILWQEPSQRTEFLEYSNKNNVMTRPFWKPLHSLPMFASCQHDDMRETNFLYDRIVHIPSSVILDG